MPRTPIPLALIGLSSTAATSWASNAHLPYLLSSRGKSRYRIVALLNSSAEAARRAIAYYNLPPETRAYGDPKDLAADPEVKLVVCTTRVDNHDATTRPSVAAGKDVIVEWPLAENASVARELSSLAEKKGVRSAVSLQGRVAPLYLKVAEILDSGRLGKVISSEVRASGGSITRYVLPEKLKYLLQRDVGGNFVTVAIGHLFDNIQHVLGEVVSPNHTSHLRIPEVNIRDASGTIIETVKSNVPDLVIISGGLPASPHISEGANFTLRIRRGEPFKGEPGLVWTIEGDKAELRLIAPSGPAINAMAYGEPVTIEVHDYATDEVTPVEWSWYDWQEELPVASRNVGALYEAFAEGGEYPTFQDAVKRHEQIERFLD